MKRANFSKKTLALLLALMTVLASLAMTSLSVAAEEDTLEGDGTEAAPYLLNTPADLVALTGIGTLGNSSKKVYIKVTADIDMTGVDTFKSVKMESDNKLFFDGQDHTISNLTVTTGVSGTAVGGIFQQVRGGSIIENLHMVNVNVDAADNANKRTVGGIVGYASAPFTMKNCSVTGTVTCNHSGTGNTTAGGLVGSIGEKSGEVVFERCLNQATVINKGTVHAAAGGIMGGLENATNYIFRYCVNEGTVSTTSDMSDGTKPSTVGGILGFSKSIAGLGDDPAQVFENCVNIGELTMKDATLANAMGGILGSGRAPNSESAEGPMLKMTNCYDVSKRTFGAVLGSNAAFAGVSCAKDSVRVYKDCYAVNKEGSTNPYLLITKADAADFTLEEIASCGIVENTETAITLSNGKTTTIAAEIVSINAARLCGEHEYDNNCDATCNKGCGYERPLSELHSFTDDCDDTCDLGCGYVRTAPHAYENACDTTCSVCGGTRTGEPHVYTNDCDADCNVCGETRTPKDHVYDDDNDAFCNSCQEKRTLPTKKPETTKAPATTTAAPATEKKGCGSAINSAYAVLALVGVLGFAFVAKKREEN